MVQTFSFDSLKYGGDIKKETTYFQSDFFLSLVGFFSSEEKNY